MICEILLPLPINKTFYYVGARSDKEHKDLLKGSLVEVEFKKKSDCWCRCQFYKINYLKKTTERN